MVEILCKATGGKNTSQIIIPVDRSRNDAINRGSHSPAKNLLKFMDMSLSQKDNLLFITLDKAKVKRIKTIWANPPPERKSNTDRIMNMAGPYFL
jgi:hypothetical protein